MSNAHARPVQPKGVSGSEWVVHVVAFVFPDNCPVRVLTFISANFGVYCQCNFPADVGGRLRREMYGDEPLAARDLADALYRARQLMVQPVVGYTTRGGAVAVVFAHRLDQLVAGAVFHLFTHFNACGHKSNRQFFFGTLTCNLVQQKISGC